MTLVPSLRFEHGMEMVQSCPGPPFDAAGRRGGIPGFSRGLVPEHGEAGKSRSVRGRPTNAAPGLAAGVGVEVQVLSANAHEQEGDNTYECYLA
jgi:hypothetical protein